MIKHRCHAFRCGRPCAPRLLMCPSCWALVPIETQREVYRTFHTRGAVTSASAAPWWRAQAKAVEANAKARGLDASREVAHSMEFADYLEAER